MLFFGLQDGCEAACKKSMRIMIYPLHEKCVIFVKGGYLVFDLDLL